MRRHLNKTLPGRFGVCTLNSRDWDLGLWDSWFVAGGIMAPYLVESFIKELPGRVYLYMFASWNATDRPATYVAALSQLPNKPASKGLEYQTRPGRYSNRKQTTPSLFKKIRARYRFKKTVPTILTVGIDIAGAIDQRYLNSLLQMRARLGELRLRVVGRSRVKQSHADLLFGNDIELHESGFSEDLWRDLGRLSESRLLVFNPISAGNGFCLRTAIHCRLPVVAMSPCEISPWLPERATTSSYAAAVHEVSELLQSPSARDAWVTECEVAYDQHDIEVGKVLLNLSATE